MNKRKWKHGKKLVTVTLVVCLMLVTVWGNSVSAEESDTSPVEVTTWDELEAALEQAGDGDVIKIMSAIIIPASSTIGSSEKRITLQKGCSQGLISFDWVTDTTQLSHVQNIVFDGAKIVGGGTFVSLSSSVEFANASFINCYSDSSPGALYISSNSQTTLNNCTFDNNKGNNGGHIMALGRLILNGCILKNGFAAVRGGAAYILVTDADFNDCTITDNSAVFEGGGLSCMGCGTVTVQNTKIFGNHAEQGNDVFTDSDFQMDTALETLQALYADENITVKGWSSTSTMNGDKELFQMQLDYDVNQETSSADEQGGDSSGDDQAQSPSATETPSAAATDQPGASGSSNQSTQPDSSSSGNTGESSVSSTNSSSNSSVTTSESNSTDTSDHSTSTTTTDNSDHSVITNNDNSDQSTVSNRYYTTLTDDQGQQSGGTVSNSAESSESMQTSENDSSGEMNESSQEQETTVQTGASASPNIRIDAKGVDCVFEYDESGGYSVSINSAASDQVQDEEQETDRDTVSWVNIVQVILLAAILLSVIWQRKPRRQGNYQE
jgi:hypothetical protein